jgi:DNA-binding winged helix-turn-helix (wHTH) protein
MPARDIASGFIQHSRCDRETGLLLNSNETIFAFRRYWVIPSARQIIRGTQSLALGGRAFDLLVVLLQERGKIVSKQDIMTLVWPSTTVDEGNLRFQMTVLRRVLDEDRDIIKTIPGRGYLFALENDRIAIPTNHIVLPRGTEALSPGSAPIGPAAPMGPDPRPVVSGTRYGSKTALVAALEEATGINNSSDCGRGDFAWRKRLTTEGAHASDLGDSPTTRRINDLEAEVNRLKLIISALTLAPIRSATSGELGRSPGAGPS